MNKEDASTPKKKKQYMGPFPYGFGDDERRELAKGFVGEDGNIRVTPSTLQKILEQDPALCGAPFWSETHGAVRLAHPIPFPPEKDGEAFEGRALEDNDAVALKYFLSQTYGISYTTNVCLEAIAYAARERPRNEIREYLAALKWDGEPRIDSALTTYAGAEESPYTQAAARIFFLSAAARGLRPGCKVDTALILHGKQGRGKSTFVRRLFGEHWTTDSPVSIGGKEAFETIRAMWCVELAELASMGNKEVEPVKAFLSSAADTFRPPYGKCSITRPRVAVFVGTTNERHTLRDSTGSRRFYPVTIGAINLDRLALDRDQLWAEAVYRVEAHEPWWPSEDEAAEAAKRAEEYTAHDPWHEQISDWLAGISANGLPAAAHAPNAEQGVAVREVLMRCLGLEPQHHDQRSARRVASTLAHLGYESRNVRVGPDHFQRRWFRP